MTRSHARTANVPRAGLSRRRFLGLTAAGAGLTLATAGCTAPFSASPRGVFVVDVTGQNLRRVADGSPIVGWSTDSQTLALGDPDGSLRFAAVDGGGSGPDAGGPFTGPGWAPDGTRRAVIDVAANELRIETAAGAAIASVPWREPLPDLWFVASPVAAVPVWSPSGEQIAFVAWDGNGDALYTIDAAGQARAKLTNIALSTNQTDRYPWLEQRVATVDAGNPAWSPDGRFLAYAAFPETRGALGGIYLVPDSGDWRGRLTDQPPLFGPAWTPDGRFVAYSTRGDQFINIFAAAVDGGSDENLTGTFPMNARYPAWSPDGRLLAFAGAGDLFVRDAAGTATRLADTGLVTESPIWAPDGAKIAFLGVPAQPGR